MEPKELKVGKVPESVLKRSVLKQIHTKRPEVILGAGVGEDCAAPSSRKTVRWTFGVQFN